MTSTRRPLGTLNVRIKRSGKSQGMTLRQAVPPIDASVKWFNADKGFGFVELADGSGDAFLHTGSWRPPDTRNGLIQKPN